MPVETVTGPVQFTLLPLVLQAAAWADDTGTTIMAAAKAIADEPLDKATMRPRLALFAEFVIVPPTRFCLNETSDLIVATALDQPFGLTARGVDAGHWGEPRRCTADLIRASCVR